MMNVQVGASERRWRTQQVQVDTAGYVLVGRTNSNLSEWAFNRLRMYENSTTAEVQLRWKDTLDVIDTQPFHTGGGWTEGVAGSWEHDFLFDLSMNTNNDEIDIMMRGLATNPQAYTEAYFYDTGYSASRPIFSSITYWDFNYFNPVNDGNSTHGYFLAKNNPLGTLLGAELTNVIQMQIENCNLDSATIDKLMIALDQGGFTGGSFTYIGNPGAPTAAVKQNYDNLISKGWSLTGLAPPGDFPTVTSYYKLEEDFGTTYADAVGGNTATRRGGSFGIGKSGGGYQGATAAGNDIIIPYIPAYDLVDTDGTLKPHTISFWFKPTNNALTWNMLAMKTDLFYIALYNGTLRWVISGGTNGSLERRSYQFSFYNDTWYCCALAYDGTDGVGGLKMYINGTHVNKSTTVGTSYGNAATNTGDIVLANHSSGTNSMGLNGVIDEVGISIGYCWDETDAATYYNNGNGSFISVGTNNFDSVSDLTVNSNSSTTATFSFTAPSSDNPINKYELIENGNVLKTFSETSNVVVMGLTPNTQYDDIYVLAYDVYGNTNSSSNVVSLTTQSEATISTTNLEAYYKLDSTASVVDSHGTHNGTNYGATTATGKIGGAYSFDGTDDYFSLGTSLQLLDDSSLVFWIKPNAITGRHTFMQYELYDKWGAMNVEPDGAVRFYWGKQAGGYGSITSKTLLSTGNYYHVVLVRDHQNQVYQIYIDGLLDAEIAVAETQAVASSTALEFGQGYAGRLNGELDEIAFYSRALGPIEISDLHNNGNAITL
jgi:hypothetical protein